MIRQKAVTAAEQLATGNMATDSQCRLYEGLFKLR